MEVFLDEVDPALGGDGEVGVAAPDEAEVPVDVWFVEEDGADGEV